MFERFDEWLNRHPRTRGTDHDPLGIAPDPLRETEGHDLRSHPSLESFSPCPTCDGPRTVRTEPVTTGTARLALVCDACGGRMEI